ncbi:hypothetical protein [Aquabacterium sp.]|uniref:hypothetical protein n=1 Tax=Aquabacterium sp. TaxID=1872578 RepID=UPI0024886A4D|nr:hypothetical protein [Aquabacterium sp.]MDI1350923.1 hypothetical protein [Aquabacterium sp.]
MKINRSGARANHGQSTIQFPSPRFSWVKSDSTLTIRQSDVKDFSTTAHHSYSVKISSTEVTDLIATLAKAATDDAPLMEKLLEPSLKHLVQLQNIAAGVYQK